MSSYIKMIIFTAAAVCCSVPVRASVDFVLYPNEAVLGPVMLFTDAISDVESDIQEYPENFFVKNREVLPRGMILANTLGYPNGKSIIKPFPHMEFGAAVGAGIYGYDRYKDFDKDNPTIPGEGAGAAVHFGTGITDRTDLTFKFFLDPGIVPYRKAVSKDEQDKSFTFSLSDAVIFSLGAKWRYNIIKGEEAPSWGFSFGGLTASVAADFMHAKITSRGRYTDVRTLSYEVNDPVSGEDVPTDVMVESAVSGKAVVGWDMISLSPEVLIYADLFRYVSVYTGPGISLNAGKMYVRADADGAMTNINDVKSSGDVMTVLDAGSTVATAHMEVREYMNVPAFVPKWTAGLEIGLGAVKLQIEAADILTSPTDSFTVQCGIRAQF
ncbi:MAG: hypothetical protein ACRCUT_04745 [Spirochaetota bacterium]